MATRANLLQEPVEWSARLVALDLLAAANTQRGRLNNKRNTEALHDFRVAVRRLRSWLRALDPWLEDSVPRKQLRRLKKAARATNASRDADVRLVWLREQRTGLNPNERRGLNWLIGQISEQRQQSFQNDVLKGADAFDRAHKKLERALRSYRVLVRDDEDDPPPLFDVAIGQLIREHATALERCLEAIHDANGARQIHRGRIAAKRLRYLFDPLENAVPGAKELVDDLGKLQDALGDSHDIATFRKEFVTITKGADAQAAALAAGLTIIRHRLNARADETFGQVRNWVDANATALLERVETIANALSPPSRPHLTLLSRESSV
jgi:CHAD domain-containing protein